MRATVAALTAAALTLVPAGSVWGAEGAEATPADTVQTILGDLAEVLTGIDVDAVDTALLGDILDTANFVVAVQRAEAEDDLLDADDESDTVDVPNHGAIVSTIARCAPRGRDAKEVFTSMKNHGAFVTVAAQGGSIDVDVPVVQGDVVVGSETLNLDLSTVEGAEALCAATALVQQAADLLDPDPKGKDARAEERDERKATRAEARSDDGDRGKSGERGKGNGKDKDKHEDRNEQKDTDE